MFVCDRYQLLFDSAIDPALQRGAGGFTVFRRDVACNHAERGRQYRGVVASGYDPFDYLPGKSARAKPDPKQDRLIELNTTLA